tara:strand:- start:8607 stop:10487 length:1881 start_codon:yes stop_codon:yes gene_type:complete
MFTVPFVHTPQPKKTIFRRKTSKPMTVIAFGVIASFAIAQEAEPPAAPAEPAPLTGKISDITLYQGTAVVSRLVDIPADKTGAFEIVIGPLPSATDPSSVHADKVKGATVRSVACRSRPPAEAAKLKGRAGEVASGIADLEIKMATANNEIALRRIRQGFLKDLQRFVAPAASQEMTHGVIQSKEIEAVTQMHFREYEKASQEILKLDLEIKADSKMLSDFKKEQAKLATGPPVTYDAVVYLDKPEVGAASINLNYFVGDCGWSPVYNVRGDTKTSGVEIEFNALIHQVSGEDWNEARIALSTASPKTSAYNPRLAPLYVGVSSGATNQASDANAASYKSAVAKRNNAIKSQYRGKTMDETASQNFLANDSAASVQLIELSERLSELRLMDQGGEEDLSIRYELATPVTLVSRRDAQMVPVLQHQSPAKFYHVAVPILTTSVFREAELANATSRDLLGGQVNIFLDGEFKGRTDIPSIARGRTFTLGFGVDGQVKARRSLVDRREDVQGGNRQLAITAEITVDNFKQEPVKLRIRERMPFMEDTAKLRVSIGETSHTLSSNADYLRYEKPKGILRWDMDVPPGSLDKSTALRYTYSLEFDKSLTLHDISQEQKKRAQKEFVKDSKK